MPDTQTLLLVTLILAAVVLVAILVLLVRSVSPAALARHGEALQQALRDAQREARGELNQRLEGLERGQHQRIEGFAQRLDQFTQRQGTAMSTLTQQLADTARRDREESTQTLRGFGAQLQQSLADLGTRNEARLTELRTTLDTQLKSVQTDSASQLDKVRSALDTQLKALQKDNGEQLEKMRATVDEKLQKTLETRLGESFKLVQAQLGAVQQGLGEMHSLAAGVGDLKRVLTNVKARGTFGEVQLGRLLEDLLTTEQYATNIATVPGSSERVEFALRMPGRSEDAPVWMPIDAKFPREDYERLLDAQDRADADAAQAAGAALERRIRDEAKTIAGKYIAPPATTEYALLFLPTEGLYAEVIRRPGLFEALQREHRVTVAGPTTLTALINALQMGFRTLAIEKRSSEVWRILGAVKTEFGKFGAVLDKTRRQVETVRNTLDSAGTRTRAIERKLRGVESLSGPDTAQLLGDTSAPATDEEDPADDAPSDA